MTANAGQLVDGMGLSRVEVDLPFTTQQQGADP